MMEKVSLRPSAYLCGLCVKTAINRRERIDMQRAAEKLDGTMLMLPTSKTGEVTSLYGMDL